jgi:hypothetical protein
METIKFGYSTAQALIVTGITLLIACAFGWHAGEILLAYVSASLGLFVFFAAGITTDEENETIWYGLEMLRWSIVAILMLIHIAYKA